MVIMALLPYGHTVYCIVFLLFLFVSYLTFLHLHVAAAAAAHNLTHNHLTHN